MFLDINMEDMDGLEAAGKIKAECPKVHIVLVTACVNYAPDGYKVKASRFFLKDDLEQTLPECVVKQKESIMQTSRDKRLLVSEKNNSRLFSAESPVYSYIPVEVHDFFYKGMHQVIKRGIIPAFYNGPQACEGGYSGFL